MEAVMKNMTMGVFAYVLAFASTPGHALSFDFSVTTEDGDGLLGLILASLPGEQQVNDLLPFCYPTR
jgi:hypothetical protein